jgi:hypothetical protein
MIRKTPMPNEITTTIRICNETGTSAYEIADYLIRKENLIKVTEQFKCKLAEWIVKNNNNDYRFTMGTYGVRVPLGKVEIVHVGNEIYFATASGTRYTSSPKGWILTRTGYLVRGKTGWLVDENGLFILKDGRRLDDAQIKNITEELRIGDEDIWKGLDEILNNKTISSTMRKEKYSTSYLFYEYGQKMDDVVYQAFQINIFYEDPNNPNKKTTTWQPYTHKDYNFNFYIKSIGTDETGIPIVVTRVGLENAKKKIVIAGPHGNERIARFVVLETQRHFIENGLSNTDLALYFIPAMSPTLFFADARGLPFVLGGDKYKEIKDIYKYCKDEEEKTTTIKKTIKEIYGFLTIPKLHNFMEEEVDGRHMHDNIQSFNISPLEPKYGIDANRDYHRILKSTEAFEKFIKSLGAIPDNITVFMMHGYAERVESNKIIYPTFNIIGQGAVYGPYKNKPNGRYLDDEMIRHSDLVTLCLFGYKTNKKDGDEVKSSENYIYGTEPHKYLGEWTQILYKQGINCYDIELAEDYRQGTRGKKGGLGTKNEMKYYSDIVINRKNNIQFFMNKDFGRFINKNKIIITFVYLPKDGERENRLENENISLSFYDFLKEFYILLKKIKENCKEVK